MGLEGGLLLPIVQRYICLDGNSLVFEIVGACQLYDFVCPPVNVGLAPDLLCRPA